MISARSLGILAMAGLFGAAVLIACSDDDVDPNPEGTSSSGSRGTSSGSNGTSSGSSADTDAGQDSGPAAVNGCRTFEDRSATDAVREVPWDDNTLSTSLLRCMQIKVGQKVLWKLDDPDTYTTHPVIVKGGDTPNPIENVANGEVTFDAPGTFGYQCGIHGSVMSGAILVVP